MRAVGSWLRRGGHLWLGLLWIGACEAGLVAGVGWVSTHFTPLVWWGYIVAVDGGVRRVRGRSILVDSPAELRAVTVLSAPLWLVFEYYNLFLDNWHYVGLPEDPRVRYLGYAVAFATILPGLLETADLVSAILGWRGPDPVRRPLDRRGRVWVVAGVAMLVLPLLYPSRYVFAPVWLGFIFLLDPLNAARGRPSFLADAERGSFARLGALLVSGYVCGLLWEFWNYWAAAKWVYTVPFLPEWRIFEMPILGFLGFGPFALEMYAMYAWVRGDRIHDVAPGAEPGSSDTGEGPARGRDDG